MVLFRQVTMIAENGRLMSRLRNLANVGGDELIIAPADCDGPAAFAVAERMRSVVAATPIVTEDGVVNVTLSISVAGSENGEGLLPVPARADLALYDAKHAGRACVREFAGDRTVRSS